ncbi:type II toxin-antitoxin system toxin TsaT [Staphylococcus warneri]|uniref:type II toxin-antitoxin system toxin TsaT n=1 Tax=Staphylococcus warneri TaxID=1292 RepID=UPI003CF9489B
MSLHFTILFWLSLIFIIAGAIILAIMLKTKKESKKESYIGFTIVFFIFGLAMLIYTLLFGL